MIYSSVKHLRDPEQYTLTVIFRLQSQCQDAFTWRFRQRSM